MQKQSKTNELSKKIIADFVKKWITLFDNLLQIFFDFRNWKNFIVVFCFLSLENEQNGITRIDAIVSGKYIRFINASDHVYIWNCVVKKSLFFLEFFDKACWLNINLQLQSCKKIEFSPTLHRDKTT